MHKTCVECNEDFQIVDSDRRFYAKIAPTFAGKTFALPEPTECPQCRRKARSAWRNERTLYQRTCSLTGEKTLSMYPADSPFPVYSFSTWFSDRWDGRTFGRAIDFDRPFFEQFAELSNVVPRLAQILERDENCDYCNIVGRCRNCYLIFGSIESEDCYYGSPFFSKNCIDSLVLSKSELCYECSDSEQLYQCFYCQNCSNSSNLSYCFEVMNSKDCHSCAGIAGKQYCFFNEQLSKEEYERKLAEWRNGSCKKHRESLEMLERLKMKVPRKEFVGNGNEDVSGNVIFNSKHCFDVYHVYRCQDVSHASQINDGKDMMDVDCGEESELVYEQNGFYHVRNLICCHWCWDNTSDSLYCSLCAQNVKNCFGCIGLRHAEYCILNQQYTKEEYEDLCARLIAHMRQTGEWGKRFPPHLSPFGYNETMAMDYFPLTKAEARAQGYNWQEHLPFTAGKETIRNTELPDVIGDIPESFVNEILSCAQCQRNFRIITQELSFLKQMAIPLPRLCPECRHRGRIGLRNPRNLWIRNCAKCRKEVQTTYSPERPEIFYCEECYLAEVY